MLERCATFGMWTDPEPVSGLLSAFTLARRTLKEGGMILGMLRWSKKPVALRMYGPGRGVDTERG